jgi:cyclopropane fatty-acyl-phospholipid synthase-like methyltransferase
MASVPNRETFENLYAGKAPWDIGKPQPAFVAAASKVTGSLLDAGCGTGENALYFAARDHEVTGIDYLPGPIELAKKKASERGIAASFLVLNALHLDSLPRQFDTVTDCGLFHVFSDEDRKHYIAGLATVLKPGGRLLLECFSDAEPGDEGPRRISQSDLTTAFAGGWTIESIEPTRFEIRPDVQEMSFSAGGPKAWFAVIRRNE